MAFATAGNLWKPEYLLDVASMDLQHKHFFQILDVLSQVCKLADKATIKNSHLITIVTELRRYSHKHFHDEEVMLAKYKYPDILTQYTEHDKYQRYILEFLNDKLELYSLVPEDVVTEESFYLINELLVYVSSWWDVHILKNDILYVDHVKKMKQRKDYY